MTHLKLQVGYLLAGSRRSTYPPGCVSVYSHRPNLQRDLRTLPEGTLDTRDPKAVDDVLGEPEGDHLGDLKGE